MGQHASDLGAVWRALCSRGASQSKPNGMYSNYYARINPLEIWNPQVGDFVVGELDLSPGKLVINCEEGINLRFNRHTFSFQ